jgi:hypothetical protein
MIPIKGVLACLTIIVSMLATTAYTQAPRPLTNAELRAKVTALEQEVAMLESDIKMLTAACQVQTTGSPSAPTADNDTRREQAELDAFNKDLKAREKAEIESSGWVIKDIAFAAIESNRVFIRYSWKATIHNSLDHAKAFDLDVQFLDDRGLIVDHARAYRQAVPAFDERTFNGSELVNMPAGLTVASIHVVATPR